MNGEEFTLISDFPKNYEDLFFVSKTGGLHGRRDCRN